MLSNLAETLHSSAKWKKNKQVAKIWGLYLKKQRFGDTMQFPEGLENTPFKLKILKYPRNCRLHATLILNLVKPLTYMLTKGTFSELQTLLFTYSTWYR